MTDNDEFDGFVTDVLNSTPTFSDEMIAKVREQILEAAREAEAFYGKKAGDN